MAERHLTVIEAAEIEKRMTRVEEWCGIDCDKCPLSYSNNGFEMGCSDLKMRHPEVYERILIKWDESLPQKTRAQDFFEKLPNAPKIDDGSPDVCAIKCGYCTECISDCRECWNQPFEGGAKE